MARARVATTLAIDRSSGSALRGVDSRCSALVICSFNLSVFKALKRAHEMHKRLLRFIPELVLLGFALRDYW